MTDWCSNTAEARTRKWIARAIANGWRIHGQPIHLAISAEAGPDGNRAAYLAALEQAGYAAEPSVDHDLRVEFILAHVGPTLFDADTLWTHERAVAEIALEHGYIPVGCETTERAP